MKTIAKILLLFFLSCSVEKQGVYFDEMQTKPIFKINDKILTVNISNSVKNSALLVYKINISVDNNKKIIYVFADQAIGKTVRDHFTVDLNDQKISEPLTYSYFWLDPDKKTTKLEITE